MTSTGVGQLDSLLRIFVFGTSILQDSLLRVFVLGESFASLAHGCVNELLPSSHAKPDCGVGWVWAG